MARQRKREYEARRGTRRSARIDARDLTEAGDESSHNLQASSSGRKRKRSSSLQIHTDNAPAKLARTKDSTRTRRLASGASDSDRDEEPDQDDITASGSEEEIASGNGEEIAPAQSDTPPATQASHTLAGSGIFSTPVESFGESLADQAFVNRYAELSNVRESRPVAPQTPAGWFTPPHTQDTRTPVTALDQLAIVAGVHSTREIRQRKNPFNLFEELAANANVFLIVAEFLDAEAFVSLYAMSKDFNILANRHLLSLIKRNTRRASRGAFSAYPYLHYKWLCVNDPSGRKSKKEPTKVRIVPGLRYLQMIHFREQVVQDIINSLAKEGHYLPRWSAIAMKKVWSLMDIPTTQGRRMQLESTKRWIYEDFYFATLFFFKVDMRFNRCPVSDGHTNLRKLCLHHRSLSFLRDVLNRTALVDAIDLMQVYAEYMWVPQPEHQALPIAGIPPQDIGRGLIEYWGLTDSRRPLVCVDHLIMFEAMRRGFDIHHRYHEFIIWGYDDLPSVPVREPEPVVEEVDPVMQAAESLMAMFAGGAGTAAPHPAAETEQPAAVSSPAASSPAAASINNSSMVVETGLVDHEEENTMTMLVDAGEDDEDEMDILLGAEGRGDDSDEDEAQDDVMDAVE